MNFTSIWVPVFLPFMRGQETPEQYVQRVNDRCNGILGIVPLDREGRVKVLEVSLETSDILKDNQACPTHG
jgi:hypothetical protein